jgi:MFS family permease
LLTTHRSLTSWSPIRTALAFLPLGVIVAVISPRAGPLAGRFGTERVIAAGLGAAVVGYGLMLRIQDRLNYAADLLPALILIGISFSVCFPMMTIQATAGVGEQEQGIASGLVQTSFQFGAAIVIAVVTAIMSSSGSGSPDHVVHTYRVAFEFVTGLRSGLAHGSRRTIFGPPRSGEPTITLQQRRFMRPRRDVTRPARRAAFPGEGAIEVPTGADAELGEDLVQVVLDGAGADEQMAADLGV